MKVVKITAKHSARIVKFHRRRPHENHISTAIHNNTSTAQPTLTTIRHQWGGVCNSTKPVERLSSMISSLYKSEGQARTQQASAHFDSQFSSHSLIQMASFCRLLLALAIQFLCILVVVGRPQSDWSGSGSILGELISIYSFTV